MVVVTCIFPGNGTRKLRAFPRRRQGAMSIHNMAVDKEARARGSYISIESAEKLLILKFSYVNVMLGLLDAALMCAARWAYSECKPNCMACTCLNGGP